MFEKYTYTGKHRKDNESLTPLADIQAQLTEEGLTEEEEQLIADTALSNGLPAHAPTEKNMAYSAVEGEANDETDTIPDLQRPMSTGERIDHAPSPSIAFKEVIADTDSDPVHTIKNIDLALKHFDADEFSPEEKIILTEKVVESSDEILHKSTIDFTDPIALSSAIDALHELDTDIENTGPILTGIITLVDKISQTEEKTVKLTPEEATAFKKAVSEFKGLPDHHTERMTDLLNDYLSRIGEANVAYHELKRDSVPKDELPLETIKERVNEFHDRRLNRKRRRQHAMATAASNLDATGAVPVVDEKNIA